MTDRQRRYAGFWIRALARAIDLLVIITVYNIFYLVDRFGSESGLWPPFARRDGAEGPPGFSAIDLVRGVFFIGFPVFYYVYLHGAFGQTFGKMALRIRVLNEDGAPIGYRKSFFRWLGYFLSGALTLGIGYLWAAFDRRKRALHDLVCRTIVVREGPAGADLPSLSPSPPLPPAPGPPSPERSPSGPPPPGPPPPGPVSSGPPASRPPTSAAPDDLQVEPPVGPPGRLTVAAGLR